MGLLSKILGAAGVDKKLEQTVKNAVSGAVNSALNNAARPAQSRPVPSSAPAAQPVYREEEPSGFSWGPVMPAEENQFNYPGSYVDYFAHVFREDFPQYRVTHELRDGMRSAVFTFWAADGSVALRVEVLPDTSETKKLRNQCAAMGLPYLRFYHNHEGWWNTRAYVTQRTRSALLGLN